jgi:hypothetical protein
MVFLLQICEHFLMKTNMQKLSCSQESFYGSHDSGVSNVLFVAQQASGCQGNGGAAFQVITSASFAICPNARLTEMR